MYRKINPGSKSNPFSASSRKTGQSFSPCPVRHFAPKVAANVVHSSIDSEDESELSVIPSTYPADPFRPSSEIPRERAQKLKDLDETIEEEPITIEVSSDFGRTNDEKPRDR
jgi:hypothetical protein